MDGHFARGARAGAVTARARVRPRRRAPLGASNASILVRHILPNVLPTVITLATLATATNILLEASLSYLGLSDPSVPSWGSMLADGQPYISVAPWIALAPGIAIVLAIVAFNLLGTALTESLETRR